LSFCFLFWEIEIKISILPYLIDCCENKLMWYTWKPDRTPKFYHYTVWCMHPWVLFFMTKEAVNIKCTIEGSLWGHPTSSPSDCLNYWWG
jgi:hypothetical protein